MKYLLLVYLNEENWLAMSAAEQDAVMQENAAHFQKLVESGNMQEGGPLEPTSQSAFVNVRGGKRVVTDGPFAEMREQLGGYALLNASSREEAMQMAAGFFPAGPVDSRSTIEVRPIKDMTKKEN